MTVDIGAEAIDRASYLAFNQTTVNKAKPATISGLVTSIDIWAFANISGLIVGTFYTTNGNRLKCRDSEAIPGTIVAGSKVTKTVSISVEVGDYIGLCYTAGNAEFDTAGFAGAWLKAGEYIDPGDEENYTFIAGWAVSLGGYIEVVAVVGASRGYIIG